MTPVVAGIGQTRFRRRAAQSEHALGVAAIRAALADAGVGIEDVDGVVRFDREAAWEYDLPGILRVGGLGWYAAVPFGAGSAPALLGLAAMAVSQGLASVVVGWHARDGVARAAAGTGGLLPPFGLTRPVDAAAVALGRWLHERGLDAAVVAAVTCAHRAAASRNPRAVQRRPLSRAEHRRSPLVAVPLREADCAPPAVGAAAFVVAAAERVAPRRRGVRVLGWSQAAIPRAAVQLAEWLGPARPRAMAAAARTLWRRSGIRPDDVDVACVHADPAPAALLALDAWGLSGRDPWSARGRAAGRRLAVNPHGGQLGEAALDGVNDLLEAVRQLRGTAAAPVRGACVACVAGSPLEPTAAVVLGAAAT